MELAERFEEATATADNTSISINSLIMNRPYPIINAKRVNTKYGPYTNSRTIIFVDLEAIATLCDFSVCMYPAHTRCSFSFTNTGYYKIFTCLFKI